MSKYIQQMRPSLPLVAEFLWPVMKQENAGICGEFQSLPDKVLA